MSALKLSDAGPVQFTYVLAEIFDFMSDERRSEVIEWTLANRYKVPEAARTAFNSSINGTIRIDGFSDANASAAPGPLLKEPLLREAPFSPEIAHNILSVWRKSRPDLREAVVSALRVNGVIEENPGSLPKEIRFDPPHLNVTAAIADVGRTRPEFELDDIALMTALVTGAVPDTSRMTEKGAPHATEAVAEVVQDDRPDEESSPDVKARAEDTGVADAPESKNSRAASDLLLEALQRLPPDAPEWSESVPELIKAISDLRDNKLAEYNSLAELESRIAEVLESHAETLAFFEWDGATRLMGHQARWDEAAAVLSAVDALAYLLHHYETIRDLGATYSEETQRSRTRVDLQEQIVAALAVLELLAPRPADSPPEDTTPPDTAPAIEEAKNEPHANMNGAAAPPHTALYLEEPEPGPKTQHRATSTTPFLEKSFATTNGAIAPPDTAPTLDEPLTNTNGASAVPDTTPFLEKSFAATNGAIAPPNTAPALDEPETHLETQAAAPDATPALEQPQATMHGASAPPRTAPALDESETDIETQVEGTHTTPSLEETPTNMYVEVAPPHTAPALDEPTAATNGASAAPDTTSMPDALPADMYVAATAPDETPPLEKPVTDFETQAAAPDATPALEQPQATMHDASASLDTAPSLDEPTAATNGASAAPDTTSMPDALPTDMYVAATAPDETPSLEKPETELETQATAPETTPFLEESLSTMHGASASLDTAPSLDEPDATPSLDETPSEPSIQNEEPAVAPSPSGLHTDSHALADQPAMEEDSGQSDYEPLHSQNGNMKSAADLVDTDYQLLSQQTGQILQTDEASAEAAPHSPSAFTNIGDVLDYAEGMWPGLLQIALNRRSERMMYFDKPRQVFDALQWLATTYYRSKSGEEAEPDLDNSVFEACGWRYKHLQPPVTGSRYRADYETTYEGRTHTLYELIGRGAGQTPNRIRLAFAWDAERRVVVVGYIGRRQRTDAT